MISLPWNCVIHSTYLRAPMVDMAGGALHHIGRGWANWADANFRSHLQSINLESAHRVACSTATRTHRLLIDSAYSSLIRENCGLERFAYGAVVEAGELKPAKRLVASTAPSHVRSWRRRQRQGNIYLHKASVARRIECSLGV